jgi:hypothetical protein
MCRLHSTYVEWSPSEYVHSAPIDRQEEHDGRALLHLVRRTRHFWQACIALFRG